MKLHESRQNNIQLFHLEGEIDLHYATALRARFAAKAKARCPALVLDLSGVSFIDSTGIAVLIEYLRDAAKFQGRFCIAQPTEHVRDVFEIIRLNTVIPIFGSIVEAITALQKGDSPSTPSFRQHEEEIAAVAA